MEHTSRDRKNPLCDFCGNKYTQFVRHGHEYRPEVACDYNKTMFPKAYKCEKYEPRQSPEEETA